MNIFSPNQSLAKSHKREAVNATSFYAFKKSLKELLELVPSVPLERSLNGYYKPFLDNSLYKEYQSQIEENGIDLTIHTGKTLESPIGVLIELKHPGNKSEMCCRDDINRKALHELLFYFMNERVKKSNLSIKYLIATNTYEYFIWDAQLFEKLFYRNHKLLSEYKAFVNKQLSGSDTKYFYEQIASKYIEGVKDELDYTYFDLQKINIDNDRALLPVFKLLSDTHLMKLPPKNDSNDLNDDFYRELLYLMGLEEKKDEHNKLIIKRLDKENRNDAALLENAIKAIEAEDLLSLFPDRENYGENQEEQLFNIALELCITWINRLLFLKLLEGQILKYQQEEKSFQFMNIDRLADFDEVNRLFFQVLARDYPYRGEEELKDFPNVPYLNSSLFEVTDLEHKMIRINSLSQKLKLTLSKHSVLKKSTQYKNVDKLPILEYLLAFLNAYNFASEGSEEILQEPKTLISASVLGLIFEKINGHKDGAVFTPVKITMYMTHEAVEATIVQKFKEHYNWNDCDSIQYIYNKEPDVKEANDLINSLRFCDPAVGSGHFLVSTLNELIKAKYDLGILVDTAGNRIRKSDYEITIDNDELIVNNSKGEQFVYNKKNEESRRIQETLFHEKRQIIENCLFGIDLNPNSVNICRLRLWIELLKNSYYTAESKYEHLETLPNIDINIKCGNSILNQHPLDSEIRQVLAATGLSITKYKQDVADYKRTSNKEAKNRLKEDIEIIKSYLKKGLSENSPTYKKWLSVAKELSNKRLQSSLFGDADNKKSEFAKKIAKLEKDEAELKVLVDDIRNNKIFANAFEWRYEIPEVLDNKGNFQGFDCIIGNPPYGVSIKGDYRDKVVTMWKKVPDYEIYYYFIQLSYALLKEGGFLSFIIPNSWLFNVYAKTYRAQMLDRWDIKELLDCSNFNIFKSVTVRNSIVTMQKKDGGGSVIGYKNTADVNNFEELIAETPQSIGREDLLEMNQNWGLAFSRSPEVIEIVNKIASQPCALSDFFESSQGYIPYRLSDLQKEYGLVKGKRIKEERQWHSNHKETDEYIQELYGHNITKYSYKSTGEFVKYGKHLACYVDLKFFSNEHLVVREITNPQIIACIINDLYVNDPQLINVIVKSNNSVWNIRLLWAVINSRLATFYHFNHSPKATKGAFPKILVDDVKSFPLPSITETDRDKIETIVKAIQDKKVKSLQADTCNEEKTIDLLVYHLYGLTYDEVLIVDPDTPITREEYENNVDL